MPSEIMKSGIPSPEDEQKKLAKAFFDIVANIEVDMPSFRIEVQELIEKAKRGEVDMHNLVYVEDVNQLTELDAKMWKLLNPDTYVPGSFNVDMFRVYFKETEDSKIKSRQAFRGTVGNIYASVYGTEDIIAGALEDKTGAELKSQEKFLRSALTRFKEGSPMYKLVSQALERIK